MTRAELEHVYDTAFANWVIAQDAESEDRFALYDAMNAARVAWLACPVKPASTRITGTVTYWNVKSQYGYARFDGALDNVRLTRGNILGVPATIRLMPGNTIEFTMGMNNSAINVVVCGIPSSRDAYAGQTTKLAPKKDFQKRRGIKSDMFGQIGSYNLKGER